MLIFRRTALWRSSNSLAACFSSSVLPTPTIPIMSAIRSTPRGNAATSSSISDPRPTKTDGGAATTLVLLLPHAQDGAVPLEDAAVARLDPELFDRHSLRDVRDGGVSSHVRVLACPDPAAVDRLPHDPRHERRAQQAGDDRERGDVPGRAEHDDEDEAPADPEQQRILGAQPRHHLAEGLPQACVRS